MFLPFSWQFFPRETFKMNFGICNVVQNILRKSFKSSFKVKLDRKTLISFLAYFLSVSTKIILEGETEN